MDGVFERLAGAPFRQRFSLRGRELAYLQTWGIERVMRHASELIAQRLAPADPTNDGRQTPWRNHPVFVAQHATATCCRGCLEKIHEIGKGHALTTRELDHVLTVIRLWLERYVA